MVVDEDTQSLRRLRRVSQTQFQSFDHAPEAVVLNEKKKLFFRFAVVIQAREANVRRARDVAHRGRVVILLGKNPRGVAENEL